MKSLLVCYVILTSVFPQTAFPQQASNHDAIDSISRLIRSEKNQGRVNELILKRAIQYPVDAYDQAVEEVNDVLVAAQRTGDNKGIVQAYIFLGNIHHKNRKYVEALGYDSLALNHAENGGYRHGESLAYGSIGREFNARGHIKEAKENYLKALTLELSLKETDTESLLTYYNQLGILCRIFGEYQQSIDYLSDGIQLAEKNQKHRSLALLYMNKANTLAETSQYDESATMHLKSIAIKERLNDSLGLAQSYGNLAIVFRRAKEYDKAISYFLRNKGIVLQLEEYRSVGLAASNLAVTHIEMGDFDAVRSFFDEAVSNFGKVSDIRGLGLAYHNYGNFLFDMNEIDSAEVLMKKALDFREKVGSNTEISSTLANLGKLYLKAGKTGVAEKYMLDAKSRLDTTQKTQGLLDVFSYLSTLYVKKGDYRNAFEYQSKVLDLEKSMFTENDRITILKAESKYELEKRDLQMAFEKEKQREKQFNIILIAALIVLALVTTAAMSLFRRRQARERHQAQLTQLAQEHRIATARALREAEEEERKRIAGKLHDEVGAQLSIARLNINQLESEVFVADSEAGAKLHAAQKLLGEMSETVRSISHSLMPIALEKYGLKRAILDLVNAVNASGKIKVEELIEGLDHADSWSDEFRFGLYRIVQEILNNIIKHAQATHILVQIVELEQSITIYMEDNGRGLDSNGIQFGVGLKLLKSNIEYFNGAIEINGRENQGTFVLIELPLERGQTS